MASPDLNGHTQVTHLRQLMQQRARHAREVLTAYQALAASSYGQVILDDLVQTVVCKAIPRLQELLDVPGLAAAVHDREVWMQEGARQVVLQMLKTMATAEDQLAALRED